MTNVNNLSISTRGLDLIKSFEGLRLTAYLDTGGLATIGWGTTVINGIPVSLNTTITEEKATECLLADLKIFQIAINELVSVPLNQNEFDALCSFVYNIGVTAFKNSTLLRYLNADDRSGAAGQFLRWNRDNGRIIKGLTNRRVKEQAMFTSKNFV